MNLILPFLSIFSIFISSGHQQELSLPQNGESRHNQDNNHWPIQTVHTVQGNFYGEAYRNVHAKPCPRRRNFQNSDGIQGVPTFTSRITKPLVVNNNNNLKPQSLKEADTESDPNILNEISKLNQVLYSNQPPNNDDLKTKDALSLTNENLPTTSSVLDSLEIDANEEIPIPETDVTDYVSQNNNHHHETSKENDEISKSAKDYVSEYSIEDEHLTHYNDDVPSSKEDNAETNFVNDVLESSENDDHTVRNLEVVLRNIETNKPEIHSSSEILPEDNEPLPFTVITAPEANINADILPVHCPHKGDTKENLNEPSRRFLSRLDEPSIFGDKKQINDPSKPIIILNNKQNEEALKPDVKSQPINENKGNKYNNGVAIVDKNAVTDRLKEEIDLNVENTLQENENNLRSQNRPSEGQLEPTRGLGISNMRESRVMLMKNTRVCYACSTVDNPTCWAPDRRTTVKYCRKEHNACVTKTFNGANSLIMVRDCGNTCNDPGITGLIPKYKSCSICHSDLCNGAYSVNSHNLMLVLFLISFAKCVF